MAHGLDIESQNAVITWRTYLELYCILEAGKMEKAALIMFWRKFFDQGGRGFVEQKEYMKVLEQLVRGTTLRKPSATTELFAQSFQKMMKNAGCLEARETLSDDGERKEITHVLKSELLVAAFEREDIDI